MTAAAGVYARLLLEQDLPPEALEEARALALSPLVREAMENPTYDRGEKERAAERLFPPETRPFLRLLCRYGDWDLLPEILADYDALVRRRDGVAQVTFTCRYPPREDQRRRLEELVCRRYGCRAVAWRTVLDPAVLGGFILTVDDRVLDRSLRSMVRDLGVRLKGGEAL